MKFFSDGGTGLIPPLTYQPEEFKKLVLELDKRGYQIMTHTLRGDTARMVLDTYEEVEKTYGPRDRRFRMEHALILSADDLPRFANLDVIVSAQPSFCCSEMGTNFDTQDKTPTDRWESLESGGNTGFGSDRRCTWPPDPFVSMQQAVERQVWHSAATAAIPGGSVRRRGAGRSRGIADLLHARRKN